MKQQKKKGKKQKESDAEADIMAVYGIYTNILEIYNVCSPANHVLIWYYSKRA